MGKQGLQVTELAGAGAILHYHIAIIVFEQAPDRVFKIKSKLGKRHNVKRKGKYRKWGAWPQAPSQASTRRA
ncbi:hypothetical protein GCM10023172_10920 [Hymenobacter ginsengisoli]|uniref:Transposase IS200-like domain-containing protein n=1 Tax=Hymenobacter ginsengisoli TaxID=1051626 RepID=A0ABP8Q4M8_9BACT